MRPAGLYAAVVGFIALWVGGNALGGWWAAQVNPAVQLPLFERALLQGTLLSARTLPFIVIAGFLLPPVLTLVAGYVVRPGREGAFEIREALGWLALWVASWGAFLVLTRADVFSRWMLVLVWSGGVSQALLVAIAFREQQRLRQEGVTRIPAEVVLGLGVLLQVLTFWGGFVAAGIPLLSGWANPRRRPTTGCS